MGVYQTGYYLIRIYDDGVIISERIEKAKGPRTACQLAYGVIYDRPSDTVEYMFCGSTKSQVLKRVRESKPGDWKKIPTNLAQSTARIDKIRIPVRTTFSHPCG